MYDDGMSLISSDFFLRFGFEPILPPVISWNFPETFSSLKDVRVVDRRSSRHRTIPSSFLTVSLILSLVSHLMLPTHCSYPRILNLLLAKSLFLESPFMYYFKSEDYFLFSFFTSPDVLTLVDDFPFHSIRTFYKMMMMMK